MKNPRKKTRKQTLDKKSYNLEKKTWRRKSRIELGDN